MGVAAVAHLVLPDSPYAMWVRDELVDYLRFPKGGTRIEIIGGEIVLSPGPTIDHNSIVRDIELGLFASGITDPAFRWCSVRTTDLNLLEIGDGYIPNLIVMEADVFGPNRARPGPNTFYHIRSIWSSRLRRDPMRLLNGGRTARGQPEPSGVATRTQAFPTTCWSTAIPR